MSQNTTQAEPFNIEQLGDESYASLQIKLLNLIGDAERAVKAAKTQEDLQACGQLARRLCFAWTGL